MTQSSRKIAEKNKKPRPVANTQSQIDATNPALKPAVVAMGSISEPYLALFVAHSSQEQGAGISNRLARVGLCYS